MNRIKSISSVLVAMLMLSGIAMADPAGLDGDKIIGSAETLGTVDITDPLANQHIGSYAGQVKISYTKTTGIDTVYYVVDGSETVNPDTSTNQVITIAGLSKGEHTVKLTNANGVLLGGDASVTFVMDVAGPVLNAESLHATATTNTITWTWNAAIDETSNVKQYHINVYLGATATGTPIRPNELVTSGTSYTLSGNDITPGTKYTITVQAEDDSIIQV